MINQYRPATIGATELGQMLREFHPRSNFQLTSKGQISASLPIALNKQGKIDPSFFTDADKNFQLPGYIDIAPDPLTQNWRIYVDGQNQWGIQDTVNSLWPFTVEPNSPNNSLRITSDGIGIGTSSPNYKLDVNGNVGVTGTRINVDQPSASGYSQIRFQENGVNRLALTHHNGNNASYINYQQGNFIIQNNGVDQFVFSDNNRFGIGTGSPSHELHVRKNQASPTRIAMENGHGSGGTTLLFKEGNQYRSWLEFNNLENNFDYVNRQTGRHIFKGVPDASGDYQPQFVVGLHGNVGASKVYLATPGGAPARHIFLGWYVVATATHKSMAQLNFSNANEVFQIYCGPNIYRFTMESNGSITAYRSDGSGGAYIGIYGLYL